MFSRLSITRESRKLSEIRRAELSLVAVVVVIGFLARIVVSERGYNYDFGVWQILADGIGKGLTPWQATTYFYGPIWAHLLYFLKTLGNLTGVEFRLLIVLTLTLADLTISYLIMRHKSVVFACVFFLNPISIIITGYHNQLDNLVIAIACLGLLLVPQKVDGPLTRGDIVTLVLLWLSLSTKHLFLIFVIWMAMRQRDLKRQLTYLFVPPTLFVLSFVPFLPSSASTVENLAGWSAENGPLWVLLGLENGLGPIPLTFFTVVSTAVIGWLVRRWPMSNAVFLYLVVVVITTPNSAGQYFAIAAIGAIGLGTLWFAPYFAMATYVLMLDYHGLHFSSESRIVGIIVLDDPVLTESIARFGLIPLSLMAGCIAFTLKSSRSKSSSVTV